MKIAVINFSGNVGKTTIARHLLRPRMAGAEVIAIESVNSGSAETQSLRGRQFAELQAYLQVVDSAVIDIGASNVEDLFVLMKRYRGSHLDFDCFVIPTVPAVKQQKDTMATLVELARLGVPPISLRLVFNMVDHDTTVEQAFAPLLDFLKVQPLATARTDCALGQNELYERLKDSDTDIGAIAADTTDFKSLIAAAKTSSEKLALAQRLANHRLAKGALPELDACFAALELYQMPPATAADAEPKVHST